MVKTVNLTGQGREAQAEAQALVVAEFMDETVLPKHRLMVNYATGVGKGKAAVDCIIEWFKAAKTVSKPNLLACFTEPQRDTMWPKQFETWGSNYMGILSAVQRECYASLHRIKGNHYGIVVLDEAQHLTELGYTFFENNTVDAILILTATEPKDAIKKNLIRQLTAGRRLIIKADHAIDAGIINDFEVVKVIMELDNDYKYKLFDRSNTLYTDYTGYLKHCALVESAKISGDPMRMKFATLARKRFIGNSMSKQLAAKYILDQFRVKNERFICIAAGIDQANALSQFTFHSKTDDVYYKEFLNGNIDELVAINQIKEGENFDRLGRGLIVQVDRNANTTVQITGRLLRLPVGQMSRVFILAAKDTMDADVWVKDALSDTNPGKIITTHLNKELYYPTGKPPQPTLFKS